MLKSRKKRQEGPKGIPLGLGVKKGLNWGEKKMEHRDGQIPGGEKCVFEVCL